jgi:hypothetical protein
MMRISDFRSKKGVTLTELSISIFIITMLIAGSFGGVAMLKAAKIRKSVNELTTYMGAINQFQTQYDYLPGDLPNASSYWTTNPATGATTHNGNGDGIVARNNTAYGAGSGNNEYLYAWEHLADAKLIPGTFDGTSTQPNSEPFPNAYFWFFTTGQSTYNTRGNAITTQTSSSSGYLLAKDAYTIDVKIDDGIAASGILYAMTPTSGCVNAVSTASSASYLLSDSTNATCGLMYWQKKF